MGSVVFATVDRVTESARAGSAGVVGVSVATGGGVGDGTSPGSRDSLVLVPMRVRIAVAPAMPIAAITPRTSVAAAPRAII
jgi:hypothetical protein